MSHAAVLALDPGGTTGACLIIVEAAVLAPAGSPMLEGLIAWEQWQVGGPENQQVDTIMGHIESNPEAAIVIEGFQLRTMAAELSPVRITAAIDWAMHSSYPGKPLFRQMPSLGKRITNDRLKRGGLYRSDGNEHARDATRHAVMFLRRAKKDLALQAQAWPHLLRK